MSCNELKRVQDDLATIRQAVGEGLPFRRADVMLSVAWAAAGVPLVVWTAFAPLTRPTFALVLGIPAAGVLLLSALVAKKCHENRGASPIPWREHRLQWITAGVLTPLLAAFLIWGLARGLSPEALTATALFMAGLGMMIVPLIDRTRRCYAGWAVATMLLAVAAPLCGYRYLGLAVGGWLLAAGLSAAVIMSWQLRNAKCAHDTH